MILKITHYFDDIINIEDLNLDHKLIVEKSSENILVYSVSYKTWYDAKLLCIIFDKVDGYISEGIDVKSVLFNTVEKDWRFNHLFLKDAMMC